MHAFKEQKYPGFYSQITIVVVKPVEQRDRVVGVVLGIFHACSKGHRFTHELPEVDHPAVASQCWRYRPRSKKINFEL